MQAQWDGAKLKKLREENKQSQGDIAHIFGVWPYTVGRWEANLSVPRDKTRRRLEEIYPGLTLPAVAT